jgi:predicted flap endonuclease-1-like 5' DNA nuclease
VRLVTEREKTDAVIALEQARAQLEVALSRDENWLALRRDAGDASRHERALADNPLYKSWKQVSQAIENLRAAEHGTRPAEGRQSGNAESSASVDELTRIRGITPALAGRLAALGITRYGDIAAWRPHDVRQVSDALGLGREISRQNWIEQAALLHRRTHPGQGEPTMAPPLAERAEASAARTEEPLSKVSHAVSLDARAQPRSIDLPDILEHIRSDAAARGSAAPAVLLDEDHKGSPEIPELRTEPRPDEIENVLVTPAPAAPQRSPIPTVEASSHVNTDAEERVKRLVQEKREASGPVVSPHSSDGIGPAPLEPEEATVTFLIREPARPAGGVPTGRALERKPLLDPRPASAEESPRVEPYVPPDGSAEEAEVAIVVSDSGAAKGARDRPAGSVRRFLKTLTGN